MNQRGLSTIAIVGIAIGAIVLIGVISLFAFGGSSNSNTPGTPSNTGGSATALTDVVVTYTSTRGGVPATVTFYKKDSNYREDSQIQYASGTVQSRMYFVNGVMSSCSLTGGSWSCQNIGSNNIIAYSGYILPTIPTKNNPYFTFEETKKIAGQDADCYKIQTETMCVTQQGLILERSGQISLTATSVRSTSSSDFVLP